MKLGRIALHAAFSVMIMAGFAGSVVTAEGKSTAADSKASSSKSSSSSTVKATGSSSVQSYAAASKLQVGTVVQLAGGKKNTVEPASSKNLDKMYGAVVDPHDLSLTISNSALQNETFVTINGTYNVLVNTQNGTIKIGDYVTMSSLDGVTMKAGTYEDQHTVFGRAIAGFDFRRARDVGSSAMAHQARAARSGEERNKVAASEWAHGLPVLRRIG